MAFAPGSAPDMTKSKTPLVLVAVVAVFVVAAALIVGVLLADGGESAGREEGVTLRAVVEDPAAYDGQTVRVSGEWAENRYFQPSDASLAMVLGDDAGQHLLVVPDLGVDVPPLSDNSVVEVRGTVHALGEDDTDSGFVQPGGILDEEGTAVLITAQTVSLTPPPRVTSRPEPVDTTLNAILRDPRAFDGRNVTLEGEATRLGDRGFVFSSGGDDVYVSAPQSELTQVQEGERVRINVKVQRLSGRAAETLERQATTAPDPSLEALVDRLPIDPGEPYLLFRNLEA